MGTLRLWGAVGTLAPDEIGEIDTASAEWQLGATPFDRMHRSYG